MQVLLAVHSFLIQAAAEVTLDPNANGLPVKAPLQKLLNGIGGLVLMACLLGVIWGAGQWALGNQSNNYSQSSSGKTRILVSLAGVFVLGSAAALTNFFFNSGAGVK